MIMVLTSSGARTAGVHAGRTAQVTAGRSHAFLPLGLRGHVISISTSPRRGGTLVIAAPDEPDSLYLHGTYGAASARIWDALYDGPIDVLDYDFHPVILERLPRLGDGDGDVVLSPVTVEPGGQYVDPSTQEVVTATARVTGLPQLTVRYRIEPGVTWQDGTPLTADDSVFSRRLACDSDTPTSKYVCERTVAYRSVDARTILWQGLPGYVDPTYELNFYAPLPRHQRGEDGRRMDGMSAEEVLLDPVVNRRPLAYGPFQMAEWQDDQRIRLVRNDHYWRARHGLPYLDGIEFRFIRDANRLLPALKAGEVDVVVPDGLDLGRFDELESARRAGSVVPHYTMRPVWHHLDFNVNPLGTAPPLGSCKDVRQAIALGTDRRRMMEAVTHGTSEVMNSVVPSAHWAYPPDAMRTDYPFDPDSARRRLDALGFTDSDGDGRREADRAIDCPVVSDLTGAIEDRHIGAGTRLRMTLTTTSGNVMREEIALIFQSQMADIGVTIDLEFRPANEFFESSPDGPLAGRTYDLALFAWATGVLPTVWPYLCSQIPSAETAWSGQNATGWCDPEYDQLGHEAESTIDRPSAAGLYHAMQQRFTDALPSLPLFPYVSVSATRPGVRNFRPNGSAGSELWNVEEWGVGR